MLSDKAITRIRAMLRSAPRTHKAVRFACSEHPYADSLRPSCTLGHALQPAAMCIFCLARRRSGRHGMLAGARAAASRVAMGGGGGCPGRTAADAGSRRRSRGGRLRPESV
eukprot:1965746-Prymnesium_polylepis.1